MILGVARVPLPRADYHNVRHHDDPGQTCPMHDHLLHWHPGASRAADIALLHWHWVPPLGDTGDTDDTDDPGAPAVLKSLSCDGLATGWDHAPRLFADDSNSPATFIVAPPSFAIDHVFLYVDSTSLPGGPRARPGPFARSFSATFTPDIPLFALLSRWTC